MEALNRNRFLLGMHLLCTIEHVLQTNVHVGLCIGAKLEGQL